MSNREPIHPIRIVLIVVGAALMLYAVVGTLSGK